MPIKIKVKSKLNHIPTKAKILAKQLHPLGDRSYRTQKLIPNSSSKENGSVQTVRCKTIKRNLRKVDKTTFRLWQSQSCNLRQYFGIMIVGHQLHHLVILGVCPSLALITRFFGTPPKNLRTSTNGRSDRMVCISTMMKQRSASFAFTKYWQWGLQG